jgi:uncharacterized protein (TIGR03435 family)
MQIGQTMERYPLERAGLEGAYDFKSKAVPTAEDYNDFSRILPAVKEMGLKLTKSTGPVTELVIDSASRPSAN